MSKSYLGYIEWEPLQELVHITGFPPSNDLPTGAEEIKVWRDESYRMKGKVLGTAKQRVNTDQFLKSETPPGARVPPIIIEATSHPGICERTLDCHITGISQSLDKNGQCKFEVKLDVHKMRIKVSADSEVAWLTDWYLNGSKDPLIFPRPTTRKVSQKFERFRDSIDENTREFMGQRSESHTVDFAYIVADKLKFVLCSVPKEVGPEWSNKLGIEYRESFGGIPEATQREAISEIVSFILGRQLLHVGYTKYDCQGNPLEQIALPPRGHNVVSVCQKPDRSPISFSPSEWGKIEEVLSKVVPSYLDLRGRLNLNEALWRYWISRDMPVGTNLPILASGLEILVNSWFRTNKSRRKGVYMPKREFEQLIEEELKQISRRLGDIELGDRILNRIKNSYRMGVNERFNFFFDKIRLNMGEVEEKAISARHPMAHGGWMADDDKWEQMILMSWAYETLFHRVFLKLLGYEGDYIDRSTLGWPERNIEEPLGGNESS